MTEQMKTKADAGRLGGLTAAQRMTPEARSERGRAGARAGIASRVEKNWAELPEADRARIRAVVLAG